VGFTGDRRLQVGNGITDRFAGGRIAALFEVLEVAVRVAGFAFRGPAKAALRFSSVFEPLSPMLCLLWRGIVTGAQCAISPPKSKGNFRAG